MERVFKRLLANLIDYAGIFPPAGLQVREALENYIRYLKSEEAWMLSRFVISHDQLETLKKLTDLRTLIGQPLSITVSGPQTYFSHNYVQSLDEMKRGLLNFHEDYPGEIRSNILELKLPTNVLQQANGKELMKMLEQSVLSVADYKQLPHRIFFEVPGYDFDPRIIKGVIKAIALHNKSVQKRNFVHYLFSGVKIRCGGTEASHFPPADYLAEALLFARDANVAVKFTAGLHHPFRHYNEAIQTRMHGFLNVFMAGILGYTQDLNKKEAIAILEDENPENFIFAKEHMGWKDMLAPILEVKMLRMLSLTTFGSCSFEDPVEDLKALNLI